MKLRLLLHNRSVRSEESFLQVTFFHDDRELFFSCVDLLGKLTLVKLIKWKEIFQALTEAGVVETVGSTKIV